MANKQTEWLFDSLNVCFVKPSQKLNYLALKTALDTNLVSSLKAMAPAFSKFKQTRGTYTLPTGIQLFEHLRVGWVHFTPGDIVWLYDRDTGKYYLNPETAERRPIKNAYHVSDEFLLRQLTSVADSSTWDDPQMDWSTADMMGGMQFVPWTFDDMEGGPFNISGWLKPEFQAVTDWRTYDDFIRHACMSVPMYTFAQADKAHNALNSACKLGFFDRIVKNGYIKPMLLPAYGGDFAHNTRYQYKRDSLDGGDIQPLFDGYDPKHSGDDSYKEIVNFFNQGEFDNNVGFAVKNNKLYDRLGESDFNAMVILGELPETIQMIKGLLTFGSYFVRPAKLGRHFKTLRHAVSDTWLGWNFGVAPTISDIKDMFSVLLDLENKVVKPPVVSQLEYLRRPKRWGHTATGRGGTPPFRPIDKLTDFPDNDKLNRNAHPWQLYDGVGLGPGDWRYYFAELHYIRRKIFVNEDRWREYISKEPMPTYLSEFLERIGFHQDPRVITEMAEAVWELIPWSWLIDYFFNLGELFKKPLVNNEVILKMAQVSSVRFTGVELGIAQRPINADRTDHDSIETLYPIAHFGAREFRRTDGMLDKPDIPGVITGSSPVTIKQLLNFLAVINSTIR